jgi:hypothetical protein
LLNINIVGKTDNAWLISKIGKYSDVQLSIAAEKKSPEEGFVYRYYITVDGEDNVPHSFYYLNENLGDFGDDFKNEMVPEIYKQAFREIIADWEALNRIVEFF